MLWQAVMTKNPKCHCWLSKIRSQHLLARTLYFGLLKHHTVNLLFEHQFGKNNLIQITDSSGWQKLHDSCTYVQYTCTRINTHTHNYQPTKTPFKSQYTELPQNRKLTFKHNDIMSKNHCSHIHKTSKADTISYKLFYCRNSLRSAINSVQLSPNQNHCICDSRKWQKADFILVQFCVGYEHVFIIQFLCRMKRLGNDT